MAATCPDVITPDTAPEIAERDVVWRLLLDLPARQRTVIVLRYYEDYDDATIAALLQCSQGTVRTHAKRALDRLHQIHPEPSMNTREQ
jgi:RNA polymerase sigma factor (sigma-70 family)